MASQSLVLACLVALLVFESWAAQLTQTSDKDSVTDDESRKEISELSSALKAVLGHQEQLEATVKMLQERLEATYESNSATHEQLR